MQVAPRERELVFLEASKKNRGKRKKYQIKIITKKWNEETASQTRFEDVKGNVRTFYHARYFADIPGGEITVEIIGMSEHCTHRNNNSPTMNMGGKQTFDQIENDQYKPKN